MRKRRTAARDRLWFSDELLDCLAEERVKDLHHADARLHALEACVKKLGAPQRELVDLVYSREHSIGHLAERLKMTAQAVYSRLFRIRQVLFDCVERRLAVEESV